jgi:hypothetical protein
VAGGGRKSADDILAAQLGIGSTIGEAAAVANVHNVEFSGRGRG